MDLESTIVYLILNTIGGTIRWVYGSVWRTIFNKPKFTYLEYLFGPKKSRDHYAEHGHSFNNVIIAIAFIAIIITFLAS